MNEFDLAETLDTGAPLPLYHQIVVVLRYRIATGMIESGQRLPALRAAAERWGVNYHTVRRAYGKLQEMGLVESRRGVGTHVVSSNGMAAVDGPPDLPVFLDRIQDEARRRFGLTRGELARLLGSEPGRDVATRVESGSLTVVECNTHQCADLAGQIRDQFALEVHEHVLGSTAPLPPGPIVGTYFHLEEMQRTWPDRRVEMFFPAIRPEPKLRSVVLDRVGRLDAPRVLFCEKEWTMAEVMADDMARMLDGVEVVPLVDRTPTELLENGCTDPVLVAPRIWGDLATEIRDDPRVLEVRYVYRESDLNVLASTLKWNRRDAVTR